MTKQEAPAGSPSQLNVYIVETRFQALVAVMIARSQPGTDNLICHYRAEIGQFLARFPFVTAHAIDTTPRTGLFRRQRTVLRVMQQVLHAIQRYPSAHDIHLHTTKLQGPLFNYYVHYLRRQLPQVALHFNIITDGAFNFHRGNMTDSDLRQMARKDGNLAYRLFGLQYYPYSGDRFGIEADVIETVYLLPKSPHEYEPTRVVDIPIVDLGLRKPTVNNAAGEPEKRGLVIGEKLLDKGYLSEDEEQRVSHTIGEIMQQHGITHVDYVKHPLSDHPSLRLPWYHDLITDAPVEVCIMENDYRVIAGVRSTGLFTAKLLAGAECSVVSVGIDLCRNRRELAMKIKEAFLGMDIQVRE